MRRTGKYVITFTANEIDVVVALRQRPISLHVLGVFRSAVQHHAAVAGTIFPSIMGAIGVVPTFQIRVVVSALGSLAISNAMPTPLICRKANTLPAESQGRGADPALSRVPDLAYSLR